MAAIASKARSGFLLVLRMLNVSAWTLAVVTPLYEGVTATPQLKLGFAGAAGLMQHMYQLCVSAIARLPDWNWLPFPSRSLWICGNVGTKWSFQTASLNHLRPVLNWSVIWAVLPSLATTELAPKMVASVSERSSAHCMSKPHWTTFLASKSGLVASFPFLSTVSFMPSSRTAAMSQGLPLYISPTLVGGYGSLASSNSFLL